MSGFYLSLAQYQVETCCVCDLQDGIECWLALADDRARGAEEASDGMCAKDAVGFHCFGKTGSGAAGGLEVIGNACLELIVIGNFYHTPKHINPM